MWILGVASSHNAAAALVRDGEVRVAVQAERLTRRKRQAVRMDRPGPEACAMVSYCLDAEGIDYRDLDVVASSSPWRGIVPRLDKLQEALGLPDSPTPRVVTVPHHLAHAEYVVHYAPRAPCLVLVADGSGTHEDERASLTVQELELAPQKFLRGEAKESLSAYVFDGEALRLVYRVAYGDAPGLPLLESMGHLWRWAARYCCGSIHEAGKVMGLAPYGDPDAYAQIESLALRNTGEVVVRYDGLLSACRTPNVEGADVTGATHYADVAAHVQRSTDRFLAGLVSWLVERHRYSTLCYSGGVALNGIANEHVLRSTPIERLVANGSAEDNGTAIGAALAAYHHVGGERITEPLHDFHGRAYSQADAEAALAAAGLGHRVLGNDELISFTADALAAGKVVGWHQGRSEFGPRALGHRSILADPRQARMKDWVNARVKHREAYRPFAPAVPAEDAARFFDLRGVESPLMLRVVKVRGDAIPAVTHVDGSGRVQTVRHAEDPRFHGLLERFGRITGVPVLLNTSFNVAGEPIVESPEDAARAFRGGGIDVLVIGNCVAVAEDP